MELQIKLFAALREQMGTGEISVPWTENMTELDVMSFLKNEFDGAAPLLERSLVVVNGEQVGPRVSIFPEDEVAVLPPVSGG